jgi:hypothetical protein
VFNNPVKIPQWILPQIQNSKSSLLFSVPVCTILNAHLAEYLLSELPAVLSSFCAPMHPLNAHLAELSESSVILFLLNSQQSSSSMLCQMLNALLAECQES